MEPTPEASQVASQPRGNFLVKEIFYSLQGEGIHAGRAAVFVRFAGCNLACSFCDTDFSGGASMSPTEILAEIDKYPTSFVVLTGGEPSLFIDEPFIAMLRAAQKYIAIETNGTRPLPNGIDWVCCSPKFGECGDTSLRLTRIDELKVVYQGQDLTPYMKIHATHYILQPCDTGNAQENKRLLNAAIAACRENPKWRLSVQLHKMIGIN